MSGCIKFVIPGEPRGKGRPRFRIAPGRHGAFVQTYTPAETRAEEGAVRLIAATAMEGRPPVSGPIELRLCAYRQVPKSWSKKQRELALAGTVVPTGKPDVDNLLKLLADGLNGVVWIDDAQVTDAHVYKRYSDKPRLVVEVRQINLAVQQVSEV